MIAILTYQEWDQLCMAQKLFDIGVNSYGVHFQFQLDTRLTWLTFRPKSKIGKGISANVNEGSADILFLSFELVCLY